MVSDRGARWAARRIVGTWLLFFLALGTCATAPQLAAPECNRVFKIRKWRAIPAACPGARWGARRELAAAWLQYTDAPDTALQRAERLLTSSAAADAAYLAGYLRGQSEDPEEQRLARGLLERALRGYQREQRHAMAAAAAGALSRLPRPEHPFDDLLAMAQLAVAEAARSDDGKAQGRAAAALAEAYDLIGVEGDARAHFLRAEALLPPWPDQLANVYLKHAAFLLDLGGHENLLASLPLFDAAETYRSRAEAAGLRWQNEEMKFAIPLNRAAALSQLGQLDAAARALTFAEQVMREDPAAAAFTDRQASLHLVAAYLAIGRGAPEEAEQLFPLAAVAEASVAASTTEASVAPAAAVAASTTAAAPPLSTILDEDYRWRVAHQLARAYRKDGQLERAEAFLRTAISIVEQLRQRSAQLQLRPWVLARRSLPHQELLSLLVELHRDEDALTVAESLHARSWLEAVLATRAEPNAAQALTAARIRAYLAATPLASTPAAAASASSTPPGASSLLATVGDREALIYVFIDSTLWRAHVHHRSVTFHQLPDDTAPLLSAVRNKPDDLAARAAASHRLLPTELSRDHAPLYIVANGALADFPFATLELDGQLLIASRPIARLPGLAALHCRSSSWGDHAVLLGDSRRDLPDAAREVTRMAARLSTTAHVGAAATRAALRAAHNAALLHIAAHGVTTERGPSILLADGDLTAADVLEARLAPRLVVLSGCSTAASTAPESWDGFPSAFLAAGSRYVIATLRTVHDDEAAQLIEAYAAQPDALDPIARLAAAQTQLAATLPARAWASYAVWGSGDCEAAPSAPTAPSARTMPAHSAR